MVAVIFRFDLKVRSKKVKKVKKGQFSKFKILKIKRTFLIQFHLRNENCLIDSKIVSI